MKVTAHANLQRLGVQALVLFLAAMLPLAAGDTSERVFTVGGGGGSVFRVDDGSGADDDGEREVRVVVVKDDDGEKSAYLGVALLGGSGHEAGAHVSAVISGSPAEAAGVLQGDVIVAVDGVTIEGPVSLTKQLGRFSPGEDVTLTVSRDGGEQTLTVTLGERSGRHRFEWRGKDGEFLLKGGEHLEHLEKLKALEGLPLELHLEQDCEGDDDCHHMLQYLAPGRRAFRGRAVLGVQLVELTSELREHFGAAADEGVLVSRVMGGMPAEQAGLEVGDVIVAVEGETIEHTGDLVRALRVRHGETFSIDVIRDGRRTTVEVTLPEQVTGKAA